MIKIYLAIPYTNMEDSAYEQVNLATLLLLNRGYNVISPITHCHPLTKIEGYTVPGTWDFWKNIDFEFIDWADEIFILVPKEGWTMIQNSKGVQAEIQYAMDNDKPIKVYTIESLKDMCGKLDKF